MEPTVLLRLLRRPETVRFGTGACERAGRGTGAGRAKAPSWEGGVDMADGSWAGGGTVNLGAGRGRRRSRKEI